ncbi:MAG: hypothetical protein IJT97_07205 [Bacteroidaceae bacterium]|nr:hypothetical protein [Bacteroidaceae bacterium]
MGKRKERACRQVGDKETQDVCPIPIAYLTAGWLCARPRIPAIAPYLRHGCMAGYPYQAPLGLWLTGCHEKS